MAKSKKKKRLTIAQIERRDNYKWGAMFLIVFISVYIYLASFLEMDKTQSHIDIQLKTLNLLEEELALTANKVEKMKRADALSKKAKAHIQCLAILQLRSSPKLVEQLQQLRQ